MSSIFSIGTSTPRNLRTTQLMFVSASSNRPHRVAMLGRQVSRFLRPTLGRADQPNLFESAKINSQGLRPTESRYRTRDLSATVSEGNTPASLHKLTSGKDQTRQEVHVLACGDTEGGRTVWLSGQIALRDETGKDIAWQFAPQVRTIFGLIDKTLRKAGGTLADLATMTVYVTDPRYLEQFAALRGEFFSNDNYPASTFITVSNLPFPGVIVEIQGTAVVDAS